MSTDPQIIQSDLTELARATGAQVIIGLDTGGDSLYRTRHAGFSAASPTETTPDQDQLVLQGLVMSGAQNPDLRVFSMCVATGVDSPPYAPDVITDAGAVAIPLDADDIALIKRQYHDWRMDGSGNAEGRFGKTPLAWLHALDGHEGVQVLDLPAANVVSDKNPWRAFATVTPAMAGVVIMNAADHYRAIQTDE